MSKKVIVVDDDQQVREIVTFALTRARFEVVSVENGQQLYVWLSQCRSLPDLIILDVMMPGEDGYQLCTALRQNAATNHIPIIMMTAHDEDIYARISTDLGAAQHITKPFHPLDLVEIVKRIMGQQ